MAVYDLDLIKEKSAIAQEKSPEQGVSGILTGTEHVENPEGVLEKKPEVAKENSYEKILERATGQVQPVAGTPVTSVKSDVTAVATVDEESRIQKLVNIAMEKGPEHAFKVAVELDDMYAIDMLHDRLSHQLFQELVNKGLIKEE